MKVSLKKTVGIFRGTVVISSTSHDKDFPLRFGDFGKGTHTDEVRITDWRPKQVQHFLLYY